MPVILLNECQCGVDATDLGFPHVLLCMAVVLQTNAYLYGMHFDSPPRTTELADALLDFIQRKGGNVANGVRLYGVCHHHNRNTNRAPPIPNNADTAWRNEMQLIAQRLNYHGPVTGFDTTIIDPAQGTYIEFRRATGQTRCRIFYKRHEKMTHNSPYVAAVNRPAPGSGNLNQWSVNNHAWMSPNPVTISGDLGPNATTMHELNYFLRATSFNV